MPLSDQMDTGRSLSSAQQRAESSDEVLPILSSIEKVLR